MTLSDPKDQLSRHIGRALSSLPTTLAKLIYLASLRDSYAGTYLHEGWITMAAPMELDHTLCQLHLKTFNELCDLRLDELCRELRTHLDPIGSPIRDVAGVWLELEPYREMIPRGCSRLQRSLFISQIGAALRVLVCSPDLALLEGRGASPPPQPGPPPPLHLGD